MTMKNEPRGIRLARRGDLVLGNLFSRLEVLESMVEDLTLEVSREKRVSERLRNWIRDRKQKDDQEIDDHLKEVMQS